MSQNGFNDEQDDQQHRHDHVLAREDDATEENRERSMASGRETDAERQLEQSSHPITVTPSRLHGVLSEAAVLSMLGIFSFFGLLARLGLIAISSYSGQPTFSILWAQVVGCAIMGAVAQRRADLEKLYLPLYVGLATGLCGSITSFSTWMADVFMGFAQIDSSYAPHGGFYNFMDGFTQSIITLAASVAAALFGSHIAPYLFHTPTLKRMMPLEPTVQDKRKNGSSMLIAGDGHSQNGLSATPNGYKKDNKTQSKASPALHRRIQALPLFLLAVLVSMWLAAILVAVYVPRWRGIVMFSIIFAPLGTWLRFYLSKLNTANPRFPWGTFLANIIGTAILAAILALQRTGNRSLLQCQILQGWDEGFCGCLTTVSTFVMEVRKMDRAACYRYVFISWTAGQLIMLLILGTVDFQRGGLSPACSLA